MTGTGWRTRLGRDNQAPIKSRRLVPLRPGGRQVARKPHLGGHRPYEPAPRTPISMTPTRPYIFNDVSSSMATDSCVGEVRALISARATPGGGLSNAAWS